MEINGARVGKTPTTIKGLDPAKVKTVAVVLKGYKKSTQTVDWATLTGKQANVFAALDPVEVKKPEEKPDNTKKPDKNNKPPVNDTGKKPPPETPKNPPKVATKPMGKLVTGSTPVAKVAIDGKDTGRWTPIAPALPLEVPAGDHVVTYTTGDGKKTTRNVTILANETAKITGVNDFK